MLVCLLPARNCEHDLPDYFESVGRFADAVVALDDGSTDRTREILRGHPLVQVLLTNPVRPDFRGWDDLENRNRLLAAAAELAPGWIMSLDADERIPADDAAALRAFVDADALPGCAYSFRVFRMHEDLRRYEGAPAWMARLFAFEPEQRFSEARLHFVPVPTTIPRARWFETTIRIQHLGSATDERRRERVRKYAEADPEQAFHPDYSRLARPLGDVREWQARPPGLPVLAREAKRQDLGLLDVDELDGPVLSAIVISRDDERTIERTVRSVVEQEVPEPFEVIVVVSGTDRTADIVREKFPQVRLVELERPAYPGEARNAGLRIARGDYVTFPGSHVELPPGSLAARLRVHESGQVMVSCATLNGTETMAGWAAYFLDHWGRLPGRPSGPVDGPPAACSYARELLLEVGGFREDVRAGEDTRVNVELIRRGYQAYFSNEVRLVHHSPCRTPMRLLRHKFHRGRALGTIIREERERGGPAPREAMRRYVRDRLANTTAGVRVWGGELERRYRRVYPLAVATVVAAWAGAWYELLRPHRGAQPTPVPRPPGPLRRTAVGAVRAFASRLGLDVVERSIYSPVPALAPAGSDAWVRPTGELGFDLDTLAHLEFLESRLGPYLGEFEASSADGRMRGYPLDNGYYEAADAAVLYAMIRHLRPKRILELGSGYSTVVSAAACEANAAEGDPVQLIAVDPQPRVPLAGLLGLTRLEREDAARLPLERFLELESGDILFVDTTHTVKHGSEVNFLVLEVLPKLRPGVVVHFHDVFLPYEYPRALFEQGLYPAEQYLLRAFLIGNGAYEVVFAGHAVAREHWERLAGAIPRVRETSYGLQAFWLRRRAEGSNGAALDYRALALSAAGEHGIPEPVFLALVGQEGAWQQSSRSPVGALGLAQLMPETARELGVDPNDPRQNLEGAASYLRQQYERFGSWPLALAAYNAGPEAVESYGGIPPYAETQAFVSSVLGAARLAAS